jgi:hypothetical protein
LKCFAGKQSLATLKIDSQALRQNMKKHRSTLRDLIEPNSGFLDSLFSKNVLTSKHVAEIATSLYNKTDKLLDFLSNRLILYSDDHKPLVGKVQGSSGYKPRPHRRTVGLPVPSYRYRLALDSEYVASEFSYGFASLASYGYRLASDSDDDELTDFLSNRHVDYCSKVMEALVATGQLHVAHFINSPGGKF